MGNFMDEMICVCGHRLSVHTFTKPYSGRTNELDLWSGCRLGRVGECDCEKFIQQKYKNGEKPIEKCYHNWAFIGRRSQQCSKCDEMRDRKTKICLKCGRLLYENKNGFVCDHTLLEVKLFKENKKLKRIIEIFKTCQICANGWMNDLTFDSILCIECSRNYMVDEPGNKDNYKFDEEFNGLV